MEQLEIFDYDYSDLGNGEKKCSKCNNFLPLTSFGKSDGGNYLRAECRSCTNKLQKVRKALHLQQGKAPENHICPICLGSEEDVKVKETQKMVLGFQTIAMKQNLLEDGYVINVTELQEALMTTPEPQKEQLII